MKRVLITAAIVAFSLLVVGCVALFVLWRASQIVPDFYAKVLDAEPADQRQASDTMIQKSTLLAGDVRKTGRWEALFTEQEVNGWLAVDLEENHAGALPPGLAEPRIFIETDRLRMACRATRGSIETVLSVALEIYLAEPGVLAIRIRSVHAGALPLPLANVLDQISQLAKQQGFLIEWQQTDGDPVALIHIDSTIDGKKLVVVDTIELADHEVYVSGTTEARGKTPAHVQKATAEAKGAASSPP